MIRSTQLLQRCHRVSSNSHLVRYNTTIHNITQQTMSFATSNNHNIPTHINPNANDKPDKLLFTPGPLTTSYTVKQAMLHDVGSRDTAFIDTIKSIRTELCDIAGVSTDDYTAIPLQGSGTYGVESVLCSAVHRRNGVLIIVNGSYGERMVAICRAHHIPHYIHQVSDSRTYDFATVEKLLNNEAANVSHIAVVHSETTSGIINDLESVGELATKYGKSYIVDAMSSFGAVPIDFDATGVDYLISSSNKCIEGVPGFSFVIARKSKLERECKNNSSSLALDLYAQYAGLESNGQFRYTPPTHSMLAFKQALTELKQEGGVDARSERYQQNYQIIDDGMKQLGFERYIDNDLQGYIITSYKYPTDKQWNFNKFYSNLNESGYVIYPGKVSKADCFRIGHIGRIFPDDCQNLIQAVDKVCTQMKTAKYAK